ncbi:GDSL-type esterase/lipase family protein [Aestuariirhabdus sp. Z084]|uniref:GDSL-type esterase/lipase family protein n=1 Tax=Aestuariirhabdus haliotis TaxID=2918751 RepID=UPI00201B3594|nr:GDSL-type esterase/lipase family protein [Aestuariirhabdus haliotis]MCL6414102.1 GDSL-type esterase/lipase family protein [Aestuariirhabdus haliotis]MCL6418034.1 GDSL-type esterase/lipase family protein [Aestuariirhabdus haliotis]
MLFGLRCWVLLVPLLLSGCGASVSMDPLPEGATILAFGDSLTAGVGAGGEGQDYPAHLQRLSGREVVNGGVSGEQTPEGRERLPELLDEVQPQLLILLEGGNDILRSRPASEIHANLAAMIEQAQRRSIPVLLVGVPQKSLFSDSAPLYSELAEQYAVPFEGELLADLLRSPSLKADPIHLNGAGYERLAQGLLDRLQEAGAL